MSHQALSWSLFLHKALTIQDTIWASIGHSYTIGLQNWRPFFQKYDKYIGGRLNSNLEL